MKWEKMGKFDLSQYETVEDRLARFWADHEEARVLTEIVKAEPTEFIVRALIFEGLEDQRPVSTGYAHEVVGSTPVNKTSALENCETSAIGRALANLGYAPKGARPSREEMVKASRPTGVTAEQKTLIRELGAVLELSGEVLAMWISNHLDREVTNFSQLTEAEVTLVLTGLEAEIAVEAAKG